MLKPPRSCCRFLNTPAGFWVRFQGPDALCPLCHLRIRLLGPPVSRDPLHRFGLRAVRRVTSTFLSLAGPRLWELAAQTRKSVVDLPAFEVLQAATGMQLLRLTSCVAKTPFLNLTDIPVVRSLQSPTCWQL